MIFDTYLLTSDINLDEPTLLLRRLHRVDDEGFGDDDDF